MNSRFVGERVRANNGLVRLNDHARVATDHLRSAVDFLGNDVGFQAEVRLAHPEGHDDLFQGRIPGAFTNAVDGHLGLPRACLEAGQGVRRGQAQIVVAVHGPDDPVRSGRVFTQVTDEVSELLRQGVPDGVGDVQRRGPRLNGCG